MLIAFNKPSGLSSQGGRGQVHTLDELLWAFAKPGKARLDQWADVRRRKAGEGEAE